MLVIGAGVAGLQAIATAKRLGAIVEAYDVRPDTKEQIESLGAKFVDTGVSAAGAGGYARELTDEEKAAQAEKLGKAVAACDVLITTAAVPGKKAPLIITEAMVAAMKPGAIVVDMAAETGGNVAGTVAGKETRVGPAHVVGPVNLPSRMPVHTSEMFSKNLYNFLAPMLSRGPPQAGLGRRGHRRYGAHPRRRGQAPGRQASPRTLSQKETRNARPVVRIHLRPGGVHRL